MILVLIMMLLRLILKIFISIWWKKNDIVKYVRIKKFEFMKIWFLIGLVFLSRLVSTIPSSCISMNNQACKIKPEIVNINSNETVFYPFSIKTSKCSGSCNNINDIQKYVFLML